LQKLEDILGFTKELLSHPFILGLLEILSLKDSEIANLREEVSALKQALAKKQGVPGKPPIREASQLDKTPKDKAVDKEKKARKNGKKGKKKDLQIHEEKVIKAADVPAGWVLVKHSPVVIEDVIIQSHNVRYQLEVWRSPDGKKQMTAELPISLQGNQFGPMLRSLILCLYHDLDSTQPCMSSFLKNIGIQISNGSINNLLIENQDLFHKEKEQILAVSKKCSDELRTDDTGAKHQNQSYFTNCINTDYFAYFHTSKRKSRINFLEILGQQNKVYTLNQASLDYYESVGCSKGVHQLVKEAFLENGSQVFKDKEELTKYFQAHQISSETTQRILTEGLLIGTLVADGFDESTIIHSDEAGQFNLFVHSLCWKHVERPLRKLKTYTTLQEEQLEEVKHQFWQLYQRLKKYKEEPDPNLIESLSKQFDQMCQHQEGFFALNAILDNIHKKKDKMLVVLKNPRASLHNNDSERDIRTFVKRRKISGTTKSEKGRKAKDTFISLKKTCEKLEISFWEYLKDRIHKTNKIPNLAKIIEQKINAQKQNWVNA